ncbi:MAG: response regulator [Nocardioides sp.]
MKGISKLFHKDRPGPEPDAPEDEPADELDLGEYAEVDASEIKVLILDDDEDIRELMVMTLERAGFDVVGATDDPEEALRINLARQPHLLLLDLHMPEVNGLEILPFFKEDTPGVRVVVVSGIAATYMTEAAMQAGANAFIVKGVSPRSIVAHLHRVAKKGSVQVVLPYPLSGDYR